MSEKHTISERLKALRIERGLSVADLAERSGVSQPYIWQIESGRRKDPGASKLQLLADGLGVGVEELLQGPRAADDASLSEAPESLKQFVKARGKDLDIREEDVRMLQHIAYRGRVPQSIEDWELIFRFLQRMLGT